MSYATRQRAREESMRRGREVQVPLPTRGIMSEAKRSNVQGTIGYEVHNLISNGIGLEMRDGAERQSPSNYCKKRIPFTFTDEEVYIEVRDNEVQVEREGVERVRKKFERDFRSFGDVTWTEISSHILIADGSGKIVACDGTDFWFAGFTTNTGKNPNQFDGLFSHHDRVYTWDTSELSFYYGDVGAITGELAEFPLRNLGNISGKVSFINSMTYNAAHGMNDILVIGTTTGWLIFYEGLNPGDSGDWRLMGRVKVAQPVSQFAVENYGSDLWILTRRGVVSARESLQRGVMALTSAVAKPVSDLLQADIKAHRKKIGWQIATRADGDQVLINVPTGNTTAKQYIFQVDAPAWQTTDYPAAQWHDLDGETEFTGKDGKLYKLVEDAQDTDGPITARFTTAWLWLRARELVYLRPTIIGAGEMDVKIRVLTDQDDTDRDITQGTQTVTMRPDNPGDEVALNEEIMINAQGRSYQIQIEVSGAGVSIENLVAGIV